MSSLTFLHPWLLTGMVAATVPVIIHLIGRRRAPTVFFAAFDFLLAVNKRLARRERIRQVLLLALRTLALVGLVLAIARPMPERSATTAVVSTRLGVIIDTSASMSYRLDGERLFDRAKRLARHMLSSVQPGDVVALVAAGPTVRMVLPAPTSDVAAVRAALDALELGGGVADLGNAMDIAVHQFQSGTGRVALAVVSDLADNSFRNLRPPVMDPPPDVRLVDAAERQEPFALGNAAIEGVRTESTSGSALARRFAVLVHNYGSQPVSGRSVELWCGGELRLRGYVDVPPASTAEKTFTYVFAKPGVFDAEVRLVADASDGYEPDDRYLFNVDVARGVRVLAVDGDPSATPYDDELFFLERGLAAVRRGDPPIDLQIVSAFEFAASAADLAAYDAVILANVDAVSAETAARLSTYVGNGGGVLFALGDKVRFEQANLAFASLLPHPLRDLHLASDSAAGTPPLGISTIDWDHPIMRPLGLAAEESLRMSRTSRYFNLDVGADRRARSVLRFENGAPALIESRRASGGRVLLLTTSIDRDMGDLVLRSVFPALIQRTVRYLAGTIDNGNPREIRQHMGIELALPTQADGLALVSPKGQRTVLPVASSTRAYARQLDELGFHRAEVSEAGHFHREPNLDVAVSADLSESDFTPVRVAQVVSAMGKDAAGQNIAVAIGDTASGTALDARGLSSMILLLVCLLFAGENLLAARG